MGCDFKLLERTQQRWGGLSHHPVAQHAEDKWGSALLLLSSDLRDLGPGHQKNCHYVFLVVRQNTRKFVEGNVTFARGDSICI